MRLYNHYKKSGDEKVNLNASKAKSENLKKQTSMQRLETSTTADSPCP